MVSAPSWDAARGGASPSLETGRVGYVPQFPCFDTTNIFVISKIHCFMLFSFALAPSVFQTFHLPLRKSIHIFFSHSSRSCLLDKPRAVETLS